jgi:polyisoprenoid-binding protein YceI
LANIAALVNPQQENIMKKLLLASLLVALAACSKQTEPVAAAPQEATPDSPPAAIAPAKVDVPAGAYTLDKTHSSLVLRVSHLGFSNYTARFKTFDAQLQFDPNEPTSSSVTVRVDPTSLDVENPPAGFINALIGKDWLDTAQFPELVYQSKSIELTAPNAMKITGDLTLHGVTKPVVLDATFNGGYAGHPMDPHARIGFSAHGTFNRSDFGIAYGIPAPGTTMGVSDAVDVTIETEFSGPAWVRPADAALPAQK